MRITKQAARIVKTTTTPTGESGILVECLCGNHPTGPRAIVRSCQPTPARIHGLVNAAHHPFVLAGARSAAVYGPWAV